MDAAALDSMLDDLSAPTLTVWDFPHLCHGFMGRRGGVSVGEFQSFNLPRHAGDDLVRVRENWRRWTLAYPGVSPAFVNQVHGNQVRIVDESYNELNHPGDGMATALPGIALCVFTADCVPVLLIDPTNRVVGAVHAGWRGTLVNVAAEGVHAMNKLGARSDLIMAALGPSIGQCCFAVDADLGDRFAQQIPAARRYTRGGLAGKVHIDLRAILHRQLEMAGVPSEQITSVGPCTKCANESYFSRRAVGGSTTGLQMSFIGFER
jgi:polyphenol oxidase